MFKFSPVTRRRWAIFKGSRLGYGSALILVLVTLVSCFAELICNNRPIVAKVNGQYYFPIFKTYADVEFGGIFETEADYLEPYMQELLHQNGNWAVFPPIRFDYQYVDTTLPTPAPSPPDQEHILGTDDRSRDVFARLLYGFRLSIAFGVTLAVFGSAIGILVGAFQGFIGGRFDLWTQRVIEVWSSQNELYLLLILSSIFQPSVAILFILLSIFGWMGLAAYVRAEFLRARQYEFVQSAIALGSTRMRVMWKHILPNTLTPVITFFPFRVSAGIMGLTALDFLGMGVPSPTPSLGELLNQGKAHVASGTWWIIISVFVVITGMIVMLNFIGEAVQKAFDPKAVS